MYNLIVVGNCRVAGCEYESGQILKILNDISQPNGKKFKYTFINK